jgi:broad specificity phosphatase PhoE
VEIYLLRHGHTPQPGTYTGSTDVELSIEGTRHVSNLSPLFDQLDFDCCFCSPLSRCRQTVSLLAIDAELIFDDCLREIDFGDWEGLSFADVQANYPEQLDKWAREGPRRSNTGRYQPFTWYRSAPRLRIQPERSGGVEDQGNRRLRKSRIF